MFNPSPYSVESLHCGRVVHAFVLRHTVRILLPHSNILFYGATVFPEILSRGMGESKGDPWEENRLPYGGQKAKVGHDDPTSISVFPNGILNGDERRETGQPEDMMRSISLKFTYYSCVKESFRDRRLPKEVTHPDSIPCHGIPIVGHICDATKSAERWFRNRSGI